MKTNTPIQYIKGVGPKLAQKLGKLKIHTVEDFLYFFPRSYDDRRQIPSFTDLKMNEIQTTVGFIRDIGEQKAKKNLSIIKALLVDTQGFQITAVWFSQPFMKKTLKIGRRILIRGKIERSIFNSGLTITVSDTEYLDSEADYKESIGLVVPVYALSAGIYQYQMRKISRQVLANCLAHIQETIPEPSLKSCGLIPIRQAIKTMHFPEDRPAYKKAHLRIVFDEFFLQQLALGLKRFKHNKEMKGQVLKTNGRKIQAFFDNLPYKLTSAQSRVIEEIKSDVNGPKVMNRLLQGDVGSGKTDVAVTALLFAIESGKKGAIMAPTEILADQHYYKFKKYLEPLGIEIVRLKGKMKAKEKREAHQKITQKMDIVVIGTHALIQENVTISDLGLIVVDEQHRFGVMQRMKLKGKGYFPHALFMTATPIPRSFMLTCYGDLDKSIIDEMPPGRKKPMTHLIYKRDLVKAYAFCRQKLNNKEQVFVVYPLIEESEKLDLKSATEGWELLKETVFPEFQVGLVHGRLPADKKHSIMNAFKNNEVQVLVSTTVIEVGIDIPNASIMIIRDAERFGLSQLHQLRGRIGRGQAASYCFLVGNPKNDTAKKRLKAMIETTDGFKIAEYDLLIRGPGDMLGTRQAGMPDFNLADLIKDEKILVLARNEARKLLQTDRNLAKPEHNSLMKCIHRRYQLILTDKLN
ncbi:ATP-dependent DNA helicase RecG [Candidatus Margulisiibacteriota bacterium]